MTNIFPLFAQAVSGAVESAGRTTTGFARLQLYSEERWFIAAVIGVSLAVLAFVVYMYRRDSVELRPGLGWLLLAFRVLAFVAILLFFLKPEQRTDRDVIHNSRVLLLVDTSQSMGLHDSDSTAVPATPSRIDQVVSCLADGTLLDDLRKVHDVVVVGFDSTNNRIASLTKFGPGGQGELAAPVAENAEGRAKDKKDGDKAAANEPQPEEEKLEAEIDWKNALLPQGSETQLGSSLKRLIEEERHSPISAIVVMTDGGQNSGIDPSAAIEAAKSAKIPVYTVGLGSDKRQQNVRIADLRAPSRAYPEDTFSVTGYVQGQGMENKAVTVELYSKDATDKDGRGQLEDTQRVTLGPDSEAMPVKFDVKPEFAGRRTYRVEIIAPPEDHNPNDNSQEADVEVTDRETKVLLFAGGPSREYRFLRNLLAREENVTVHTFLQCAKENISQDGDDVLYEFPSSKEELFEYDAIVAFDPNWEDLDETQIDLVEQWVGEEAGGLVVVAGPIFTHSWTRNEYMKKIRDLYPVEFSGRLSVSSDADLGGEVATPLHFTRDGLRQEFLWLGESEAESEGAWETFPGVFACYPVKGAKPGAATYAHFSESEFGEGDEPPVYFASQIYGMGRVFYAGSGEMWRLNSIVDEHYFEQLYTKLLRYVSQGRLLRGSSRGVLFTESERYSLGNTVVVTAQLSDSQHDPLVLPSVVMQVTQPDGTSQPVTLSPNPARKDKGEYLGQFTVLQDGAYRLDLPVPDTVDEQLSRRIQVHVPQAEQENPQRNDVLLTEIARNSGGAYYIGLEAAIGNPGSKPLVDQLRDRKETTILSGAPNRDFEHNVMRWTLGIITGLLCLEWLIRRLSKLA